jgi:hypothetical protein
MSTSIADLLKAGGASDAAIKQLTPAAKQLTKAHLMHLWLSGEHEDVKKGLGSVGANLPKAQLNTADLLSIAKAYENAFNSHGTALASPQGFLCGWSCCCCTPCCSCCAVAVLDPNKHIA